MRPLVFQFFCMCSIQLQPMCYNVFELVVNDVLLQL